MKGKVTLKDVQTSEGLPKETISSFIQKKISELEKALSGKDAGELVLTLDFDSKGKIKNIQVISSSLKNSRFQKDIIDHIKKWQFPTNQAEAKVTITLVFSS
jgi:TonB family protein